MLFLNYFWPGDKNIKKAFQTGLVRPAKNWRRPHLPAWRGFLICRVAGLQPDARGNPAAAQTETAGRHHLGDTKELGRILVTRNPKDFSEKDAGIRVPYRV